jgi:hypothetical protein
VSETRTPTVFQDSSVFPLLRRHWAILLAVTVALVVIGAFFRVSFYDRGYAPEQPINYSHKLHAGDLGIDCRYCHFNSERGKHAGIPPTSVCLGCHAPDKGGVNGDKPEIQKLIAMATAESGAYTDEHGVVHEGGAIHWNRVHKLPDFVYFSHQWHVKAGVACQTCHGPIQEMTVVRQFSNLNMGWCIDCHRKTNYVGGREYDPSDPSTFTVGTGNYDVIRERIKPDELVTFVDRQTKKNTQPAHDVAAGGEGHGTAPESEAQAPVTSWNRPFGDAGAPTPTQDQALVKLLEQFPQLKGTPTWRLSDLPESHRVIYRELIEEKAKKAGKSLDQISAEDQSRWLAQLSFQNSPTQCSTCHQ